MSEDLHANQGSNLEDYFDALLEQKLKGLHLEESLPEELKKEVFNTIDTIGLMAEVVDLFAIKFPLANLKFFDADSELPSPGEQDADPDSTPEPPPQKD
ncbi:MAG: hypothetical protein KatS3mg030_580 [Saprospiraceae bacterium]|nr:MAG: hypothetical protein KatS3mg030_580 [Saprospiraceae bacterium]